MSTRIASTIIALACVVTVSSAHAADLTGSSVTIEGFAGWQSLNVSSATAAVGSTSQGNAVAGGDILFKAGLFGLGVAVDKGLGGSFQPWDGSILAGLVFDILPSLRIEGLGEVGRRGADIGDWFNSNGQTFLGIRPGLSFRLEPTPVRIGASAPIRWPTSGGSFGSPDYGFIGKVGIEIP